MDTLSHVLLGAAIGQCALGRQKGNKALLTGAAIALVPDIDVAIGHLLGDAAALTFHRGITHSLLFSALLALLLGWLLSSMVKSDVSWRRWTLLSGAVLLSHLAIDTFTSYGIQLLLPFSDHSFALASVSVIDPLFTLPLLATVLAIPWLARQRPARNRLAVVGITLSCAYLALTLVNKHHVTRQFEQGFAAAGIGVERLFVKPTMFNNLLWRAIAETETGYQVGFYSLRDNELPGDFVYFPRNEPLLKDQADSPVVQDLRKVSEGFYQVVEEGGQLYFRDLRYGQAFEWLKDDRPHVFTYRLIMEKGKVMDMETLNLRVERGRDRETFAALVARIMGSDVGRLTSDAKDG